MKIMFKKLFLLIATHHLHSCHTHIATIKHIYEYHKPVVTNSYTSRTIITEYENTYIYICYMCGSCTSFLPASLCHLAWWRLSVRSSEPAGFVWVLPRMQINTVHSEAAVYGFTTRERVCWNNTVAPLLQYWTSLPIHWANTTRSLASPTPSTVYTLCWESFCASKHGGFSENGTKAVVWLLSWTHKPCHRLVHSRDKS